jgi:bifunctional UDP-N-acetylglucosamine pyrophosphorylase / glucosamine-1-phosphate N-acetyltransferase
VTSPAATASPHPSAVIILAAGEGTRMKSATPKVLHEICGASLLGHVVRAARVLEPEQIVVVVGHGRDAVVAHLAEADPGATAVVQEQQNGTGHAVRLAMGEVRADDASGPVVVVAGDTPLLTAATIESLLALHAAEGNAATVLSARVPDPFGYGRIVRDSSGAVTAIVEQKDATDEQRAIDEINSGVYAFDARALREALGKLTTDNVQGEEYLTDVVAILRAASLRVGASVAADADDVLGINDRAQLAVARRSMRDRIAARMMRDGVTLVDPLTTWIDVDVEIARDVLVHPNTQLQGRTTIATGADVGPNSTLRDTTVGEGASVINTVAVGAVIGPEATVGPFTYLRPGTVLERGAKAGGFVEMKNAHVGEGSKVPHLSYVGDATIGTGTNIGAATVFVNYDGRDKHHTTIGDEVRVGSDTMLVAPITVGDGAYTAAGSVITEDVPPGALAIARGRQRNIDGWVAKMRPDSASAKAAELAEHKAEQVPDQEQPSNDVEGTDS